MRRIAVHLSKPAWRGAWVLSGMALGAFGLALLAAGEIYDYQDSVDGARLPEVDVIVCLAGGRGRIAAAGDLWFHYWELSRGTGVKVPYLYFSGLGQKSNWNALVRQFRPGVLTALKSENVVLENESTNTDENARFFAARAKTGGWKRVLLVTSRYHMRRARLIFERVLATAEVPVKLETLSVYQEPFEPGEWRSSLHGIRVTLEEYFKWVVYRSLWRPN